MWTNGGVINFVTALVFQGQAVKIYGLVAVNAGRYAKPIVGVLKTHLFIHFI